MTRTSDVRSKNRSFLLQLLVQHGPLSKANLAQLSGLSQVTVNAIANELLHDQFLVEIGKTEGSAGRPAGILDFHPKAGTLAGLDIQQDALTIFTADIRGEQRQRHTLPIPTPEAVTGMLLEALRDLVAAEHHGPLRQVALAVPAPVHPTTLQLQEPNSLTQLDLPRVITACRQYGLAPLVDNDANFAAVAEQKYGQAQGHPSFGILVQRRSGIGLGLVLADRLYQGEDGRAGEIALAHWPLNGQPTPIEQLPSREQDVAIAYLVSGSAVTLSLSQVVVYQACPDPYGELLQRLRQLLPPDVPVVQSSLGDDGPALGALATAIAHHAHELASSLTLSPRPLRSPQEAL